MEEPKFVATDSAQILKDLISDYQKISGVTVNQAQPEYLFLSCLAYREALVMNRINQAGKSQLLEFSKAPITDYIASLLGVERLVANKASCTLKFDIVDGHLQVLLPLGTRVASSDGSVIFETIDDVIIPIGQNSVEITAECQQTGKVGNDYNIGDINVIQDPYAFVKSVSNIDATKGGSDEESDTDLIARVKLAPSTFSVAGSKNAYIYWAKSASALIEDVAIITLNDFMPIVSVEAWDGSKAYQGGEIVEKNGIISACIKGHTLNIEPINNPTCWISSGCVNVYALLQNGEVTTQPMNDIILSKLSSNDIRPLTDIVRVVSAEIFNYSIKVEVTKTKEPNTVLTNRITTAINNYIEKYSYKLGFDIVVSKLESLCMADGVYDVKITLLDDENKDIVGNLSIKKNQVSKLTGLTVTINSINE